MEGSRSDIHEGSLQKEGGSTSKWQVRLIAVKPRQAVQRLTCTSLKSDKGSHTVKKEAKQSRLASDLNRPWTRHNKPYFEGRALGEQAGN